jgi:hypothetical protein
VVFRVLPRSFTLTLAWLYLVIGIDSRDVPIFPYWVWPVTFTAIAAGIVHTTFKPDRYKLRLITALTSAAGLLRGFAYSAVEHRFEPVTVWFIVAMLSVAYYFARRDQLPEHYDDRTS